MNKHYFAACGGGWGTGESREAAIKRMLDEVGRGTFRKALDYRKKLGDPGLEGEVIEVLMPNDAAYTVNGRPSYIVVDGKATANVVPLGTIEIVYFTGVKGVTVERIEE